MSPVRRLGPPAVLLLLAGCGGIQSALEPRGPAAQAIATLGWIMFAAAAVIFAFVFVLTAYALFAAPERRGDLGGRKLVVGAGIVFPVVALTALLVYGLFVASDLQSAGAAPGTLEGGGESGGEPVRIAVSGEQWWWRVTYLDRDGKPDFATANEIRIPVGRPVELILTARDVIHSFWVPSLAGKLDMIPGHVNTLRLSAGETGVFRGQCAEYCGGAHALMAFYVVVQTEEDYRAWLEGQRRPAPEPAPGPAPDPAMEPVRRGADLFLATGCGACHAVRGTPAEGRIGPDLTHVGGRVSLAAGILPNEVGAFAGWIANPQHLKPEAKMPPFDVLESEELNALAAYLESLE